jgi:uncharacterized Zn-binding protein involved in type VI secretion
MPKPATFMGAMHVCPMVTMVGIVPVPHVGGPVMGTAATVLVAGPPAVNIGDMGICVGPPDSVALASVTVMAQGKPMARMGDLSGHGGTIVLGMPTIIVGD